MRWRSLRYPGWLLLVLAACADSPIEPLRPRVSSMSFSYYGPVEGTFRAEGESDMSRPPLEQTFAHGRRSWSPGMLEVQGVRQRSGGTVDWVAVVVPRPATGSLTIDSSSCPPGSEECPRVLVALEMPTAHGSQARYSCWLDEGGILVDALAGDRATGRFSGSGRCVTSAGELVESFRLANGRFDVRVVQAV